MELTLWHVVLMELVGLICGFIGFELGRYTTLGSNLTITPPAITTTPVATPVTHVAAA